MFGIPEVLGLANATTIASNGSDSLCIYRSEGKVQLRGDIAKFRKQFEVKGVGTEMTTNRVVENKEGTGRVIKERKLAFYKTIRLACIGAINRGIKPS